MDYAEGTRVGYRGWYGADVEPAFWFGAGLGWGAWDYRSAEQVHNDDDVALRVVLANTADRASREVVQVYWRPDGSAPVRLVGYAVADEVVPGEERTVTVHRTARAWDDRAPWCASSRTERERGVAAPVAPSRTSERRIAACATDLLLA